MKVLHILNELKHSGAEVMLQLAHETFTKNRIESHILSTGDTVGDYAPLLQQVGYKIHHLPFRKSPGFLRGTMALLMQEHFTVVHIHTERAFIWYVLLAKICNVATVIRTFHSVFLFSSYLRWKRTLQRKISSKLCRSIHVAISDSVLAVEKHEFDNNCVLVRNWTDVHKFRPPTEAERQSARHVYQIGHGEFSLLTIGTCSPVKNHMAILASLKRVNDLINGKRFVLLHVGTGPSLLEEQFYIKRHGMEQYCRLIGTLDDVRACLYAADAFVMTSNAEGLGVAAIEAMSTGVPVILYNVYGLRDFLKDGKGGVLIEPNEDSLVAALLEMNKNPDFRRTCALQAREKIIANYSLKTSVDKLITLYRMGNAR